MKKALTITALLLSLVLILLVVIALRMGSEPPASSETSSTAPSESQGTTAPTTEPTTVPTTATTTIPTQPASPPVTRPIADNPKAEAFIAARMTTWKCPVRAPYGEIEGSRTFASSRGGGKRAHAGLDFVAPHGTKVYAVTSGEVQRVAVFYENTYAVEVKNDDGSILRYCEIATDLRAGDRVEQGSVIGTILRAESGTEMLHIEIYYGDGEGALTQSGNDRYLYVDASKNYMRRSDLLDPTFLSFLEP